MLINLLCADFNLDDPLMYILYAIVLVFIVALAVFYLVSSLMRAKKLGMDMLKIKKVITSSISFSILPAIGIALGIVTLVGSLGVAFPAIRLSVIGSLQYETQMADGAANAITGSLKGLEILMLRGMTAQDLVTIATVMSLAIMAGFGILSPSSAEGGSATHQIRGRRNKERRSKYRRTAVSGDLYRYDARLSCYELDLSVQKRTVYRRIL